MLSQQLLSMAPQSIKVVTSQLAHRQSLKRSVEVVRTLKPQKGLFEVTPTSDLWWGAAQRERDRYKKTRNGTEQELTESKKLPFNTEI